MNSFEVKRVGHVTPSRNSEIHRKNEHPTKLILKIEPIETTYRRACFIILQASSSVRNSKIRSIPLESANQFTITGSSSVMSNASRTVFCPDIAFTLSKL